MMPIKKIIMPFSITVLLSGCAGMNSDFSCPMQPGVMCKSLDQVNAMVDHGQIGSNCASCMQAGGPIKPNASKITNDLSMRIWIAPFTDQQENYHEASILYADASPKYLS